MGLLVLQEALEKLLRYFGGLQMDEIAAARGISPATERDLTLVSCPANS